jgi:hypothetical protein
MACGMPAMTLFRRTVYLLRASATLFCASMAAQDSLDSVTTSSSDSVMAFMAVEPESSKPPTFPESMVLQPTSATPLASTAINSLFLITPPCEWSAHHSHDRPNQSTLITDLFALFCNFPAAHQ